MAGAVTLDGTVALDGAVALDGDLGLDGALGLAPRDSGGPWGMGPWALEAAIAAAVAPDMSGAAPTCQEAALTVEKPP